MEKGLARVALRRVRDGKLTLTELTELTDEGWQEIIDLINKKEVV
jgi:hypothetical protein